MTRPLTLISMLAVLALPAAPAAAQELVPSAGGGAQATPGSAAKPPGPLDPPDEITDPGPDPVMGPCGPTSPDPRHPDRPDRKPHGEVFGGVGTHGYREAGGVVCQPLGDHAAVTIAIDAAHIDGWRRR
ncbi:MAG TPA: hypothetical protein VGS12_18840 [Caulobacteraceae bacterium]|nr:hypothetical protein [Caulobacteraceae bacterium]